MATGFHSSLVGIKTCIHVSPWQIRSDTSGVSLLAYLLAFDAFVLC